MIITWIIRWNSIISSRNWIAVSSNSPRSWSVSAGTRKVPKLSSPEEQDAAIELAPFSVDSEMGDFPLRLVRRVAERGCRQVLHPIIRFHLGQLGRRATRVCSLARHCGHAGVMEFNGDVYACDHFVFRNTNSGISKQRH